MYEEIIGDAVRRSNLLLRGWQHIMARTAQMRADQQEILGLLRFRNESGANDDLSFDVHSDHVVTGIKQLQQANFEAVKVFNLSLNAADKFQLRFNKMPLICDETLKFYGDDEVVISKLLEGKMPVVADYDTTLVPVLGSDNFWGNNDATIFSNALLNIMFYSDGTTIQDYMYTSIAHVIPTDRLPPGYKPGLKGGYNYAYDFQGKMGFGVVHGGYAFGGQRQETTFEPKLYGPEDCSSWVAKMTHSAEQYSTMDLLCAYRSLSGKGLVPTDWAVVPKTRLQSFGLESYVKHEQLQPGDIWFSRSFKPEHGDPDSNLGAGGHCGFVVGADPQDPARVLIFGFNRDMERQDKEKGIYGMAGAGIESKPRFSEGNTQVMYLRTNLV